MKKNSTKNTPNYIISKLLLNSLYGRLGMNPITENHIIIENEKAVKFYQDNTITDIIDFNNGKEMLSFFNIPSDSDEDFFL